VTVTDRNGTVLGITAHGAPNNPGSVSTKAHAQSDAADRRCVDISVQIVSNAPSALRPVLIAGERAMHVESAFRPQVQWPIIRRSIRQEQIVTAPPHSARACCLVWVVADRRVRQPMAQLLSTVHAWGSGDFPHVPAFAITIPEFGQLATTFDAVVHELEARTRQLAAAKERAKNRRAAAHHRSRRAGQLVPRSFWSTRMARRSADHSM